jgi:hypothetical protein
MGVNMRIVRTILAPAILTVGTIGALVAGPVLALTTAAAPTAAAASATPSMSVMHGSVAAPNMVIAHG